MKRFNTITRILDTGLITSIVITGKVFIALFASDVGVTVGISLSGTRLQFFAIVITQKILSNVLQQSKKNMMQLSCSLKPC